MGITNLTALAGAGYILFSFIPPANITRPPIFGNITIANAMSGEGQYNFPPTFSNYYNHQPIPGFEESFTIEPTLYNVFITHVQSNEFTASFTPTTSWQGETIQVFTATPVPLPGVLLVSDTDKNTAQIQLEIKNTDLLVYFTSDETDVQYVTCTREHLIPICNGITVRGTPPQLNQFWKKTKFTSRLATSDGETRQIQYAMNKTNTVVGASGVIHVQFTTNVETIYVTPITYIIGLGISSVLIVVAVALSIWCCFTWQA
jgi:hypothetical protein